MGSEFPFATLLPNAYYNYVRPYYYEALKILTLKKVIRVDLIFLPTESPKATCNYTYTLY